MTLSAYLFITITYGFFGSEDIKELQKCYSFGLSLHEACQEFIKAFQINKCLIRVISMWPLML